MNIANYHQEGGYYTALHENFQNPVSVPQPPLPISLTDPSNIFQLQNAISDNLNQFETTYSRYMRCQDPNVYQQVQPGCDVDGQDSFTSLQAAYMSLSMSMKDMDTAIKTQINTDPNAETNQEFQQNAAEIPTDYESIVQFRNNLDRQLQLLYLQMEKSTNTSESDLISAKYMNTLWIILATCLLYYIFVEL